MSDEPGLMYCDRCHCSVPLDEFRILAGAQFVVHDGPMRDRHIDRFVDPDEFGFSGCDFVQPAQPRKVQR